MNRNKSMWDRLKNINSTPVLLSTEKIIKVSDTEEVPVLVVEPGLSGIDVVSWVSENREFIEKHLSERGSLLFRGFDIRSTGRFEAFIKAASEQPIEYLERSSPRSRVGDRIYTSTEYPADQSIFFHNENSYARSWPMKLFFFCQVPASEGGETPLADSRRVYERIQPKIRERFERKGVMYVRNFTEALGLSWQTVFQTRKREEVESYCRQAGYTLEWREGNRLRTQRISQAVARHPKTGEPVWFNHAAFFHISTLPASVRESLLSQFDEDQVPNNTYYGDGSAIEPDVLEEIRNAYESSRFSFAWKSQDILLLDNMLISHSRNSFTGPRCILVGMSEPFDGLEP